MTYYTDTLEIAARRASAEFGRRITVRSLRTRCKTKEYTRPRWFCMAYIHATGRYSLPQIANMFKLKDHTTVLYGLRRAYGHGDKESHRGEPLWKRERFENMVFMDGFGRLAPQSFESVNFEQLLAIGARNLALAISDLPRVQERRAA